MYRGEAAGALSVRALYGEGRRRLPAIERGTTAARSSNSSPNNKKTSSTSSIHFLLSLRWTLGPERILIEKRKKKGKTVSCVFSQTHGTNSGETGLIGSIN